MATNQEGKLLGDSRTPHSPVYLHVGEETRWACTRLEAPAFSVGNHIFAKHDIARSDTSYSRALLAHELTHTQQNLTSSDGTRIQRADPVKFYTAAEAEQLAKKARGQKTDYDAEAMKLLAGTNFAGLGANQIPLLNAADAMEKLSLLQAAGQVVSYIPGGIGTVLSASFQIPTKAIAAYSNIMIDYVAKVDAASGGSSSGAKLVLEGGEEIRGDVIAIARGASVRQMGDVMSIILMHKEVLQDLTLEQAKSFIVRKLQVMITEAAPGGQSVKVIGARIGQSTSDIPSLIKQRNYVFNFES